MKITARERSKIESIDRTIQRVHNVSIVGLTPEERGIVKRRIVAYLREGRYGTAERWALNWFREFIVEE